MKTRDGTFMIMGRRQRNAGMTLTELIVTVGIAAILLAVAAPSFTTVIQNTRLTTQIGEFNGALLLARSEAIKRRAAVTVCQSANGAACGGGMSWETGWIVFVDTNDNAALDTGEVILRVGSALDPLYTLRGTAGSLSTFITFRSNGAGTVSGIFVLCKNSLLNPSRAVLVNAAGRITRAPDSNNDGIPEDAGGSAITSCTP